MGPLVLEMCPGSSLGSHDCPGLLDARPRGGIQVPAPVGVGGGKEGEVREGLPEGLAVPLARPPWEQDAVGLPPSCAGSSVSPCSLGSREPAGRERWASPAQQQGNDGPDRRLCLLKGQSPLAVPYRCICFPVCGIQGCSPPRDNKSIHVCKSCPVTVIS